MSTITVPPPLWNEVKQLAADMQFAESMDRAIGIRDAIEVLETELARIKEQQLEPSLVAAQVKGRVRYKDWEVGVVQRSGSVRIDRKKLVAALEQHGVPPEPIVSAASIKGTDSVYLWLGRSKQPSAEEDQ